MSRFERLNENREAEASALLFEGYGAEDIEVKIGMPADLVRDLIAYKRARGLLTFRPMRAV